MNDRCGNLLSAGDRVRSDVPFTDGKITISEAPRYGTVIQVPVPGYEHPRTNEEAIKIRWDSGMTTIGDGGPTLERI